MALDPSIALRAGPQGGAIPTQFNPLDTIGSLVGLQQKQIAAQSAQAEFGARQKFGQLMATAPDLDAALEQARRDPDIAPWAADLVSNYTNVKSALLSQQGQVQQQGDTVRDKLLAAAASSVRDPSSLGANFNTVMAGLSPEARKRYEPLANSLQTSLTLRPDGRPIEAGDPNGNAILAHNIVSRTQGAGIPLANLDNQYGQQSIVDAGNNLIPVNRAPMAEGGGLTQQTGQVKIGNKPALGGLPNQAPQYLSGTPGGVTSGGSPGNAFGAQAPTVGGVQRVPQAPGTGEGATTPTTPGPTATPAIPGLPSRTTEGQQQAEHLLDIHNSQGTRNYNSAATLMSQLDQADDNIDRLAQSDDGKSTLATRFLQPGAGSETRTNIAKTINTIQQITGAKPTFEPEKVATAEDLRKQTLRMGAAFSSESFGSGHLAAQTINTAISSVPSMENTYLGAKLVSQGIRQQAQRIVDQHEFEQQWLGDPQFRQANGGNANDSSLQGADIAFNKAHPAEQYAQAAMAGFGLTPKGFASPQAIVDNFNKGLLTRQQANDAMQRQFPDEVKKKRGGG